MLVWNCFGLLTAKCTPISVTILFTMTGFSIYKYNVVSEDRTKHCNLLKFVLL